MAKEVLRFFAPVIPLTAVVALLAGMTYVFFNLLPHPSPSLSEGVSERDQLAQLAQVRQAIHRLAEDRAGTRAIEPSAARNLAATFEAINAKLPGTLRIPSIRLAVEAEAQGIARARSAAAPPPP